MCAGTHEPRTLIHVMCDVRPREGSRERSMRVNERILEREREREREKERERERDSELALCAHFVYSHYDNIGQQTLDRPKS